MKLTYPVSTIDDMYHACDPDTPLASAKDSRYQDLSRVRGQRKSWISNIAKNIERNQNVDKYFSMLFSGHRGSGKTTELHQLKAELEAQKFFVVYIDIEDILEMNDIEYQDVLLAIAESLYTKLEEKGWELDKALLENLHTWFAKKIIETDRKIELSAELTTEASAGIKSLFGGLMAKLKNDLKNSSTRREFIRKEIGNDLTVFKAHLNNLITATRQRIQKQGYKSLVIIVDGLEKMLFAQKQEYSNHYELFMLHAEQLKWVNSHIIYTVPITLASQTNLKNEFSDMLVMPMVKVENSDGKETLRDLIKKRVNIETLFEDTKYVDELIKLSGGAIRDLMILLRSVTETDAEKVTHEDIEYAKSALIKFYSRQLITLTDDDKLVLQAVYYKKPNKSMESYARLTNNRVILEYENGELWQALHPAVLELDSIKALLSVTPST
ncbi:hypothetical protein BegalDRAFT_1397 [Beggiatoa alba B18LD]|uniref:Uncharacterized protein n=1 Tax=Beggiatoa alba B18LD TaxID=395493 RepID=I3CF98_9GAMM|nr:AAA family ATPase [Beggiatoa alba]EIJ42291.1 hypothetical protein BegalDRAFT_1397 [Beggiatoa alba B18LD]